MKYRPTCRPRTRRCCGSPFPQIVAVLATCAVAYGVYRYFPFGPSGLKLGIAILLGAVGIAMTVGKVGGRGLPLVCADLLKFNLGARRYAGSPAELAVSEPPPQPEARPDPLRLLAKKAVTGVGKAVKAARRKGRAPFRPHSWFGKGRRRKDAGNQQFRPPESQQEKPPRQSRGRLWGRFLPVAALALLALVLLPGSALADDPDEGYGDAWRLDEIYFQPPDPVPGRRVYVERLAVSGDTAAVTPAGRPRPGPEGAGLRRQDRRDAENGLQHQPAGEGRPRATT